ncbi:hypothetical protein [Actinoplanes sp. GCM10030250]|uniref:hypothetical protein n=1 Tax=Actinoplanes sp. GCM10030250 TaxID=3273376 RepID=UPI003621DB80
MNELLEQLRTAAHNERCTVLWKFQDRPDAAEVLRGVRRNGPGRLRAAALEALMFVGGEAALAPADVAAAERLIRIRRRTEPVGPLSSCWTTWWCVRSTDQEAVMAAIGLTAPRPVTYHLAADLVDILEHDKETDADLVIVGAAVNGWVPVVGPWCDAFNERSAEVQRIIERLSTTFGEAHAFYFGAQGDGSAWLVAREGVTVRRFDSEEPETSTGEPLEIERAWLAEHGITGPPEANMEHDDMFDFFDANVLAAAISVDIGWHLPEEPDVAGLPVMATVPGAAPMLLPRGSYRISGS